MARIQLELMRQAFFTALDVNTDPLQVLRGRAPDEAQVSFPKN